MFLCIFCVFVLLWLNLPSLSQVLQDILGHLALAGSSMRNTINPAATDTAASAAKTGS